MTDPANILHLLPLVEQTESKDTIHNVQSYKEFRRKISLQVSDISEEHMFALYCYYYGKRISSIAEELDSESKPVYISWTSV